MSSILEFEKSRERTKGGIQDGTNDYNQTVNGPGPILVFIGDSLMTVDPVLAQGFTIAMESGASMARSLERVLVRQDNSSIQQHLLRDELKERHYRREQRLLNLLRSTELVQRLAQPNGLISGFFATWIFRSVMKYCPEALKKTVFDHVIRYSLGLTGRGHRGDRR
jgi:flavin-dependent dehydrogenase